MVTIDASVWVIGDSPGEDNHEASRSFLDLVVLRNIEVVIPHLACIETAAAIRRARNDVVEAREFAEAMLQLKFVRWISVDREISEVA